MTTVITATPAAAASMHRFRASLERQRAICVRQHELALSEMATSVPDPVAVHRAASTALTIDEIDAALGRIADGTYGRCAHCGVGIPVERLTARPFAAGCVACQASVR